MPYLDGVGLCRRMRERGHMSTASAVRSFRLSGPETEPDLAVWGQDRLWLIAVPDQTTSVVTPHPSPDKPHPDWNHISHHENTQ